MAAVSESFISASPEVEVFVVCMVMLDELPNGTDSALIGGGFRGCRYRRGLELGFQSQCIGNRPLCR